MRKPVHLLLALLLLTPALYAGNQVMGEIEFKGKSKIERDSGVWVDGGYVGYLKELKGSKRVLLLPGEHTITVRQNGYQDFVQRIQVRPGEKQVVNVEMSKAPTGAFPAVSSEVKLDVNPNRAAVFLDGQFVGHVREFEGLGRGLLVAPGAHKIQVSLPGYQTFETQINPLPRQKVEVKTDLLKDRGIPSPPMEAQPTQSQAVQGQEQPTQPQPVQNQQVPVQNQPQPAQTQAQPMQTQPVQSQPPPVQNQTMPNVSGKPDKEEPIPPPDRATPPPPNR